MKSSALPNQSETKLKPFVVIDNVRDESASRLEIKKVYKSFLSMHRKNSKRTEEEYKSRVDEFFRLTLKKSIGEISIKDIKSIKKSDVQMKYIDFLSKDAIEGEDRVKNSNSSIRTKLNSVRSFYNELLANDIIVNPMIFKNGLKVEVKHHESLSLDELQLLFDFMKNEKDLAMEKYLLVKILFTTANRKTATMGLKAESGMTWEDNFITRKDLNTGEEIHIVRVQDKGQKWIEKPISDEFYEELQQINNGQKYVFEMNPRTLSRSLERFSKTLGKKITPHGLKATAITVAYMMTRSLELCRQLGGHSSIATTEIYIHEEKSLVNQLSYGMSDEMNSNALHDLTHNELLNFIDKNEDIKRLIMLRLNN